MICAADQSRLTAAGDRGLRATATLFTLVVYEEEGGVEGICLSRFLLPVFCYCYLLRCFDT